LYPETEVSETQGVIKVPHVDGGSNLLDAASKGVHDGLHLALNVAAMLVAFITLIALADKILLVLDRLIDGNLFGGAVLSSGEYSGFFPGSLKTFFGTIFSPLAYLMGVPMADVYEVGNLLGIKLSVNEFLNLHLLSKVALFPKKLRSCLPTCFVDLQTLLQLVFRSVVCRHLRQNEELILQNLLLGRC